MKRLRVFRDFNNLSLEKISEEVYEKEREKSWKMGFETIAVEKVLEFKKNLRKDWELRYGKSNDDGGAEYFKCEFSSESSEGNMNKKFSIRKVPDFVHPFYVMNYREEYWLPSNAPNFDKFQGHDIKSFYRFEEHDLDVMCKNPQLLLDYLDNQ